MKHDSGHSSGAAGTGQAGMALVVSMIILLVMTVLGIAALQGTTLQTRMAGNLSHSLQVGVAAESGIKSAVQQLIDGSRMPPAADDSDYKAPSWASNIYTYALGRQARAEYRVRYLTTGSGASARVITDGAGEPLYVIESSGYLVTSRDLRHHTRAIVALDYSASIFREAITACDAIAVGNGAGAGQAEVVGNLATLQPPTQGPPAGNILLDGDVWVEGIVHAIAGLGLHDVARIIGDAYANGNIDVDAGASISGAAVWPGGSTPAALPVVDGQDCDPLRLAEMFSASKMNAAIVDNDNADLPLDDDGAIDANGAPPIQLGAANTARRYYLTRFSATDQSFAVSGKVELYVNGPLTVEGSSVITLDPDAKLKMFVTDRILIGPQARVNTAGNPGHLQIYSSLTAAAGDPDAARIEILAGEELRGVVYAPGAPITVGPQAQVRGALWGGTVSVASGPAVPTRVVFDELVTRIDVGRKASYQWVSWRHDTP